MKAQSGTIKYASQADYFANRGKAKEKLLESVSKEALDKSVEPEKLKDLAEKSKISDEARKLKDVTKESVKNNIKSDLVKLGSMAKDSAIELLKAPIPSLSNFIFGSSNSVEKGAEVKSPLAEKEVVESSGVFFISGWNMGGLSEDGGLKEMSELLPGSKHFSWSDEEKVMEEIAKLGRDKNLILVGHSLGGDAVVSIAKKLNSMDYSYRPVDLAVTLDSVGYDNDIIPPNVKTNMNFIGDTDLLFNDGPNIAFNNTMTEVMNELRRESHVGIDDSNEVRQKILNEIEALLVPEKSSIEKINMALKAK